MLSFLFASSFGRVVGVTMLGGGLFYSALMLWCEYARRVGVVEGQAVVVMVAVLLLLTKVLFCLR